MENSCLAVPLPFNKPSTPQPLETSTRALTQAAASHGLQLRPLSRPSPFIASVILCPDCSLSSPLDNDNVITKLGLYQR